jgi:hypothetical protein
VRIPLGVLRVQVSKDGFETLEAVLVKWNRDLHDAKVEPEMGVYGDQIRFDLNKPGTLPSRMVTVPAGEFAIAASGFQHFPMETYLIDKYEVTNRQYKEFVDKGGYQNRVYWKEGFVQDGQELTWEEAMRRFRDVTGRPAPATWEGGVYPAGQDQYPVRGVSWYEAAAYAEFAGKSLPTLYHWHKAALVWLAPVTVPLSNFDGAGPVPVGQYQGLGPFGTYDMAATSKSGAGMRRGRARGTFSAAPGTTSATILESSIAVLPSTAPSATASAACATCPRSPITLLPRRSRRPGTTPLKSRFRTRPLRSTGRCTCTTTAV